MKKIFITLLFCLSLSSIAQDIDLDLRAYEIPYVIKAPKTSTAKLLKWGGEVEIYGGKKFQITAMPQGPEALTETKDYIEKNNINKLKRYLVKEDSIIIYETAVSPTMPEFHFMMVKNFFGQYYTFAETKSAMYSEQEIRTMVNAIKNGYAKNFDPLTFADYDLREFGIELSMKAPKDALITQESWGDVNVTKDENFQIEISKAEPNAIIAMRQDIETNAVNKFKKYIVKQDSVLIYETSLLAHSEYHFIVLKKINKEYYAFKAKLSSDYKLFDIQEMVRAVNESKFLKFGAPVIVNYYLNSNKIDTLKCDDFSDFKIGVKQTQQLKKIQEGKIYIKVLINADDAVGKSAYAYATVTSPLNFTYVQADPYIYLEDFNKVVTENNGEYIFDLFKTGISTWKEEMMLTLLNKSALHYQGNGDGTRQMYISVKLFAVDWNDQAIEIGQSNKLPIVFAPKDLTKHFKKYPTYKLPTDCKYLFPNVPTEAPVAKVKEEKVKEEKVKKETVKVEKEETKEEKVKEEKIKEPFTNENIVKFRPTALYWKSIDFGYEKVLSGNKSFSVRVAYNLPTTTLKGGHNDLMTSIFSDYNVSGFSIVPEMRFYTSSDDPNGFYLAPYLRFRNRSYNKNTVDSLGVSSVFEKGSVQTIGAGISAGYQWTFKSIVLDWNFAGIGANYNMFNSNISKSSNAIIGFKTSLMIGYSF